MLKLKNITKNYDSGDTSVQALKGINIEFRKSEFVSILGQSGCGKTTLLNIIGGLDRYTDGDLIINGKSTKQFKDKDWDAYRNYSVGFVFQSYNLIPHQTVLSNVELALTLSGVSKKERREKAIKALKDVGLGEQIHKKPNQLSGGQMQRVAIARALVNDPDIILADEPTGALDTKTSVQIMEILKEISKDKLIVMVTHNPEIAEKYSTRIVKILDGLITDDSMPFTEEDAKKEEGTKAKSGRTSMKFFTALKLSLNNLMTKKGRTILTSFAGSIGIIGIALILAISTGVQNYINKVEEDTLSSYPITIEEATVDISSMMETMMGENEPEIEYEEGKIYSVDIMNDMISTISSKVQSNNLEELKKYLEEENNEIKNNSTAIHYNYDLNLNLYKENGDEEPIRVNPSTVLSSFGMGQMMESESQTSMMATTGMATNTDVWSEMLDNEELVKTQYNLVAGNWPTAYNEVVLIVSENNEITDYTLYALGLKDQDELKTKMEAIQKGETIEAPEQTSYTYEEL
ncbi:MAG: ABC transporter ATP-binding protein, partial [Treponema sp.]|nr:ABC transporter ATP-binding protein [Treponema sp.]